MQILVCSPIRTKLLGILTSTCKRRLTTDALKPRTNEIDIQMLSEPLHNQLFGGFQTKPSKEQIDLAKQHLKQKDLLGKTTKPQPELEFPLPPLVGPPGEPNIANHFYILGKEQEDKYLSMAEEMAICKAPPAPKTWATKSGWTRYNSDGTETHIESLPEGESVVFDVEVLYKISPFPIMAIAVSPKAWYSWVAPGYFKRSKAAADTLVKIGYPDTPRLIIGHHIAYDRARIEEEYRLKPTEYGFMDTLSLHSSIGGLSSQQRPAWIKYHKEKAEKSELPESLNELALFSDDLLQHDVPGWEDVGSPNRYFIGFIQSLKIAAKLHLGIEIDKGVRDEFAGTDMEPLREPEKFQSLMEYCAKDVLITFQLYQHLYPQFRAKCPHPVSFAGSLQMSKGFLPTTSEWDKYIARSEKANEEYQSEIENKLETLVQAALKLQENEEYRNDPWLRNLDWTVKPVRMTKEKVNKKGEVIVPARHYASYNPLKAGKPKWYLDLWDPKLKDFRVSMSKKVTPLLLHLEWKGYPLIYHMKYGWMYHTPSSDNHGTKEHPKLDTELMQDIVLPDRDYFRVPHPSGDGKNTGNPLAKSFIKAFENGTLTSSYPDAAQLLMTSSKCVYWISARERIKSQFVVWDTERKMKSNREGPVGVIIPQTLPMGTITRRAVERTWLTASNAKKNRVGSELKSIIEAPKGYHFVGADVDSQELWIASLMGDAQFGVHGATAFGFMTLQGTKSAGTDLHSSTGKIAGISRDVAKIFNYSRIYGAGATYATQLLMQHSPGLTTPEATKTANQLYLKTKGMKFKDNRKRFGREKFWHGGTETFMFNQLEKVATSEDPRTPVLGSQIPNTLMAKHVGEKASIISIFY